MSLGFKPKEVMRVRGSRKKYIPLYLMVIAVIVFLVIINNNGVEMSRFLFAFSIVFIILVLKFTEVHRFYNLYEINPGFLVHRKGIFNVKTRSVNFGSVSDLDVRQNPWQWLLGFGDVHVRIFSEDTEEVIKDINKPHKFAEFLENYLMQITRSSSTQRRDS